MRANISLYRFYEQKGKKKCPQHKTVTAERGKKKKTTNQWIDQKNWMGKTKWKELNGNEWRFFESYQKYQTQVE